jgi:hypothetical protein
MNEQNVMASKTKSRTWLWILVIVLAFSVTGYIICLYITNNSSETSDSSAATTTKTESWVAGSGSMLSDVTSTDTHKLADGTYRTYYMKAGEIVYAVSPDGLQLAELSYSTGITEDTGKFMSNPAVLQVSENQWIMIYEQAPQKQPGASANEMPGVSNQRNLYLATSVDGKAFQKVGLAIDSSTADKYFASVPDLVKTPDGQIRMYYVSGGDAIGSAISIDSGKTWQREAGYRLEDMAVDPDVLLKTSGGKTKWVMYYTDLNPSKNAIYKATSADGLAWTRVAKVLNRTGSNTAIVDPDVYELSANKFAMYFGQSLSGDSTGANSRMNLFRADLSQSIF